MNPTVGARSRPGTTADDGDCQAAVGRGGGKGNIGHRERISASGACLDDDQSLPVHIQSARAGDGAGIGIKAVAGRAVAASAAGGVNPGVGRRGRPGAAGRGGHSDAITDSRR